MYCSPSYDGCYNCVSSCDDCQGGCTNKCQGCVGCHGGCTSKCNNGCYSGCTSKCVGCHSCNACQSCVGSNCNSCNGSCTGIVHEFITCDKEVEKTCSGCFCSCQGGCTTSCASNTDIPAQTEDVVVPPTYDILEISSECYGEQGGNYDKDVGSDHGYGGVDQIKIKLKDTTSDEIREVTIEVPGEKRNGKVKGSDRDAAIALWAVYGSQKDITKKLAEQGVNTKDIKYKFDNASVELTGASGKVVSKTTYSQSGWITSTSGFSATSYSTDENGQPVVTYTNPHTGETRTHSPGCSSIL